jgi:ectoine hydroxylase-related dioxygenase (phytanoyl-CoA dioxygenase family)
MKRTNLHFYRTNGYLVLNNFLTNSNVLSLKNLLKNALKKYLNYKGSTLSFENKKIHQKLIKFRKKNPKNFGEMYDDLNLNATLRAIFYQKYFIDHFSQILDTDINNIFINGFMFRLDAPFDKRNSLDWHQDSSYYHMSYPKFNSGVCWIPLTNNSEINGSLMFIPSNNPRFLKKTKSFKKDNFTSEQYTAHLSTSEIKKIKTLKVNLGDAAFFNMNIKHRSGINSSEKIRITIGCRFHDMSKSFNVGKEIYFFNKTTKPKLF